MLCNLIYNAVDQCAHLLTVWLIDCAIVKGEFQEGQIKGRWQHVQHAWGHVG